MTPSPSLWWAALGAVALAGDLRRYAREWQDAALVDFARDARPLMLAALARAVALAVVADGLERAGQSYLDHAARHYAAQGDRR